MENLKIKGKLKLRCFRNKDGNDCRALVLDLGYSSKFLTFRTNDIAEYLDMTPRAFVDAYPCPADKNVIKEYDISLV